MIIRGESSFGKKSDLEYMSLGITFCIKYPGGGRETVILNENKFQWKGHITSSFLCSSVNLPIAQPYFNLNMAKVTPVSCQNKSPKKIKICHH